ESRGGVRGGGRTGGTRGRRAGSGGGGGVLTGEGVAERDEHGRRRAARPCRVAGAYGSRREQALGVGEPEHGPGDASALLGRAVAAVVDPEHSALERNRDALVREAVQTGKELQAGRGGTRPEQARDRRADDLSRRGPEPPKPPGTGPLLHS